ncbi:MAG: thioredoxin family protein [Candidatus Methanomethylophilaceae archaeon]|jgi:small redox-active disulfide protein 2|nr:thioredoxin family protein [Candidatus Methanomethylophilaceae archaeon]MDD3128562.1 thioredoxin family protein [Candidatus Methanomethylophilaceae archaeon]MDD4119827.1 thioredoxin family protein [Candidatus Methanomethylophilaceae archaeon]MDD4455000.1 thioredoxin family protein [Candidatus Methanomethylophilaceae archaeon]
MEGKNAGEGALVKVLGTGCSKCRKLEANTREALKDMGMPQEVDHVSDVREIMRYGVMSTPALVVGRKVFSPGKVLGKEEIKGILEEEAKE